jgi:hypothetical protein
MTNADSLSDVLADIGSRNSDVLLSDAVLFVEGPGDRRVFARWGGVPIVVEIAARLPVIE